MCLLANSEQDFCSWVLQKRNNKIRYDLGEEKWTKVLELKWIENLLEKSYLVSSIKSTVDSFIWQSSILACGTGKTIAIRWSVRKFLVSEWRFCAVANTSFNSKEIQKQNTII